MNLLKELRTKIKDMRHSQHALTISVTEASSAIMEVTGGRLVTSISGGTAPELNLGLTDTRYDTIGKLHQAISRSPGYVSNMDADADPDHASIDIDSFGPTEFAGTGVSLHHHVFSDQELEDVLVRAVQRHNPSLTPLTMPPSEAVFVMMLAQASVYRQQAYDASKRKGLTKEISSLIQLAESLERAYADDTSRLARAIQSPKEANPNVIGEGDFVMASFRRQSLRTGLTSPFAAADDVDPAVLLEPDDVAVEDDNVKLSWQRNKNTDFSAYELWVDHREGVKRWEQGRQTTSRLVRSTSGYGRSAVLNGFITTYENVGQNMDRFVVEMLEPETTYYFQLFVTSYNGIISGSNVVRVTTKPLRARFRSTARDPNHPLAVVGPPLSLVRGPAGTVVRVYLNTTKGEFTSNHTLMTGEKTVAATIVSPYVVDFTVPSFQFVGPKSLTIVSPTSLIDVLIDAFTVEAT